MGLNSVFDVSPSREVSSASQDAVAEQGLTNAETELVNTEKIAGTITMVPKNDLITTPSMEVDKLITLKVKDVCGVTEISELQTFVYTDETTIGDILIDVSCAYNLDLDDVELIYQDKSFSYNFTGMPHENVLKSVNIVPDRHRSYFLCLELVQKKRKIKPSLTDLSGLTSPSGSGCDFSYSLGGKRDFVGLKNRNMTCYLNSFLQGIWFTPEFRNALYNYNYDPKRCNRKSLCYPLQKLFLQQQFSIRDSIDTDELIKTFGWEDRETWNQHDIEELCSQFMENLTTEFRGTQLDGIIQALYFGTLDDYVKCLECERVSQRSDDFLVIPLPIRNFGSLLANPTLEAALNSFVAYEVLDGNNMYQCSQCNKPCNAHKGLRFNRLPYILTIQLKRFEYDFIKDRRHKLNDRVAFPQVLDMNPYISNPSPDRRETLKTDLLKPKGLSADEPRVVHSRPSISLEPEEVDEVEPQMEGATGGKIPISEQMKIMVEEKGPEVYQLFGVMVHRGGINSGHYYAYILDFEQDKWYRCDDAAVRRATISDLENAFGGDADEDRELTSAYMLLYRRYDMKLNLLPYFLNEMPAHMQKLWEEIGPIDKLCQEEEELVKNTVRMGCLYKSYMGGILQDEKMVAFPKNMTMLDAALFAFMDLFPEAEPPAAENLRLCRFDKDLGIIENSFDELEHMSIASVLKSRSPITKNESFFLQQKTSDTEFEKYRSIDLVFRAYLVDCYLEDILNEQEIHMTPDATVNDLKSAVRNKFCLLTDDNCLVAHYQDRFYKITEDIHPLSVFKFQRITNLYVQVGNSSCDKLSGDLIDFLEQYTKAEVVELHLQGPLGYFSLLMNDSPDDTTGGNVPPPVTPVNSDVCIAIEDSTETSVITPDADKPVIAVSMDCAGSANDLSNANVAASQSDSKNANTQTVSPRKEYYIKFLNQTYVPGEELITYTLRIDGQTPLSGLSRRLSELVKEPETDFVMYKVVGGELFECRRMTERIHMMRPFDQILVKQEHRLQDGEARMKVFALNVGCIDKPFEFLTEIIVTIGMDSEQIKAAIHNRRFDWMLQDENLELSKMRIRKKTRNNPSKIMRSNIKLQDIFSSSVGLHGGELYMQLLDQPSDGANVYCFIYRLWHPSTGILDACVEVSVLHDHSDSLDELVTLKIRESLGVDESVQLEAAKPEGTYPWNIPARLIQDLVWFPLIPPVRKSMYIYTDELSLFVRDKNEEAKEFYDNRYDEDQSQRGPRSTSVIEPPRREPGLKLNLAKSPPQN